MGIERGGAESGLVRPGKGTVAGGKRRWTRSDE